VGNIAPSDVTSSNLDNFITAFSQPAGSTYYAYFTSGLSGGNWPVNAAGFFTSYVGTNDTISRQEYRPVNSNAVYQRTKNTTWGAWATYVASDISTMTFTAQIFMTRLIIHRLSLENPTSLIGRTVRIRGIITNLPSETTSGTLTTLNGLAGSWKRVGSQLFFEVSGTLTTSDGGPNDDWLYLSQTLSNVVEATTYTGTATLTTW
jgi:hypothetical protein